VRVFSDIRDLKLRSLYNRKFLYLKRIDNSFNTRGLIIYAIIFLPGGIKNEINLNLRLQITYKIGDMLFFIKKSKVLF